MKIVRLRVLVSHRTVSDCISRLPDLKGSVYVYDADALDPETNQLKLIKKYEGIADKPIKVFWKNNRK